MRSASSSSTLVNHPSRCPATAAPRSRRRQDRGQVQGDEHGGGLSRMLACRAMCNPTVVVPTAVGPATMTSVPACSPPLSRSRCGNPVGTPARPAGAAAPAPPARRTTPLPWCAGPPPAGVVSIGVVEAGFKTAPARSSTKARTSARRALVGLKCGGQEPSEHSYSCRSSGAACSCSSAVLVVGSASSAPRQPAERLLDRVGGVLADLACHTLATSSSIAPVSAPTSILDYAPPGPRRSSARRRWSGWPGRSRWPRAGRPPR